MNVKFSAPEQEISDIKDGIPKVKKVHGKNKKGSRSSLSDSDDTIALKHRHQKQRVLGMVILQMKIFLMLKNLLQN
jgi:hypothetical protein